MKKTSKNFRAKELFKSRRKTMLSGSKMPTECKNNFSALSVLKIASVFTGAVLGAGFAGGKELVSFFVRFGKAGVYASLFAGVLFLILGSAIVYKSYISGSATFSSYLKALFPKKTAYIFSIISEVFLLVCFVIMLAGGGALAEERFNIPSFFGSLATAFIAFLVFSGGIKGLGSVCSILTPIMIIGILYVTFFSLATSSVPTFAIFHGKEKHVWFYALLYVSYNMLSSAPVLTSAASLAENKRTALIGAMTGGLALCAVAFLSCMALYSAGSAVLFAELPLLMLSGKINKLSHTLYAAVLYMAILTTAFSAGFPIVKRIEHFSFSTRQASLLLCAVALPLSFFRLSFLIEHLYPFFGILGLFLIIAIFWDLILFRRKM